MKVVDFYKLARAIQDRFVGSVRSGFPPAPLVSKAGGKPTKFIWLGLSFASVTVALIVTRIGYGSLESSLSRHSLQAVLLYGALAFGLVFGLMQAFARSLRERALPYQAGIYLFPGCLIDARDEDFKVYSTENLVAVDVQGSTLHVSFSSGSQFGFACADPAVAAAIQEELKAARESMVHPRAEEPADLVALDPLHNPRFSSPVGPRESYEMRLPPWKKFGWAASLVAAAVLAPSLWALRNAGSDKIMYARATRANNADSYRAYLARGTKFRDEVAGTLLPRAELRDAQAALTVEALLEYKAQHPALKIRDELEAAIRSAMLAELAKATRIGTLTALHDFAMRYPDHGVAPELTQAIHAVYARELVAYMARSPAPPKDKSVAPFVEQLFAYAEKYGSRVEIRFRRRKSESLGRADQQVAKTPSFMGEVSYPSRQFDEKRSARREEVLGNLLAQRLDAGLSPELFDVTMGASVAVEGDPLPSVKVPTLFVTHVAEWSGHTYVSTKPRGTYVGMIFTFDAHFVIPGDARALKVKFDVVKSQPPLGVLKDEDLTPGPAEERVYETMATDAFASCGEKLLGRFFAKVK